MGRSACCDKAAVKRGPWTAEEDERLRSYIQQHGTGGNWIALPRKVGLRRCGKSCRLRWLNYLRPDIRHGAFSHYEDRLIFALHAAIGSRWSVIAAHLPGRTDNDVKNYWNTKLKKRFLLFSNAAAKPPLQLHGGDRCVLLPHANNHQLYAASTSSGGDTVMHVGVGEGSTSSSTVVVAVDSGGGSDTGMLVVGGGGSSTNSSGANVVASYGYDVFAAGQSSSSTAATSFSSGATAAVTELDEIFRSTVTSGGGGGGDCSSSAQSTDALMMMNWYNQNQLQLQCELQGQKQQQHLGFGLPYWW
uniref:Uncharacterized protein n=1 Tax=Oryza punctata TaxID=4537 RepID=A0A0E0MPZ2_ORYPU